MNVFFLFFLWRMIDFLVIYLSSFFLPYLGFFPYQEYLADFGLPAFITKLANFDGVHYLLIAKNGYQQFEQAFFPFYPLLIRWLSSLFFNNLLLTGVLITNIAFFIGLYFFYHYLLLIKIKKRTAVIVLILLLFFPSSFFFGALYTEGLFFLLVVLALYFLKKENYWRVFWFSFFASLTRLNGIFLFFPIFFHLLKKMKNKEKLFFVELLLLIAPFLGLFFYGFYLWQTTGDPLFFFHSQPAFGANRSTRIIFLPQVYWRYFKIFLTAKINWQYFISLVELTIFNLAFFILILDFLKMVKMRRQKNLNTDRFSLNLFSLANLILPTLTGTFSSLPRYCLLSLSFFVFLSEMKNKKLLIFILLIFLFFHLLLLAFFSQGYFVS